MSRSWYCLPMLPRTLLLSMLLLLGGCNAPPQVELSGEGALTERSSDATAGTVLIHVANPTSQPIDVVEFVYTAQVPGHSPWQGRHAGGLVLAPGFDRMAELPVVLPANMAQGTQVRISGSLHYLDTSTIAQTMAEWGYRPTTSFSGKAILSAAPVPAKAAAETP
jgi:hypothetical protein